MIYENRAQSQPNSRGWDEDQLITLGSIMKPLRRLTVEAMSKGDKKRIQAYQKVEEILMTAPAADAAPVVHAHWEHLGGDEWCCTACGHVITTEGSWETPTKKHCDECGAKMNLKKD